MKVNIANTGFLLMANERGGTIVIILVHVILLIFFSALAIDLSRFYFSAHLIQRSVDAASLAGSGALTLSALPDATRWRNAKRAVLAVLRRNMSRSDYPFPDLSDNRYHQGLQDACETTGNYRSQIYDNGRMRVALKRGVYQDTTPPSFQSLEDNTSCNDSANPAPNAVWVKVTIYHYPIVFGTVQPFGFSFLDKISRSSVGISVN